MSASPMRVVCGLVFSASRVLATRRDASRHFPLLWEFPGGKIEPGETEEEALVRELREELHLEVSVYSRLDTLTYRDGTFAMELIPFLCRPDMTVGPVPVDHPEIRWIEPGSATALQWAPPDLPLIPLLPRFVTCVGV